MAFDVDKRLGALDFNTFGIQPRGPSARCLRFVVTVARVLLDDHARLASRASGPLLLAVGTSTRRSHSKFWIAPPSFDQAWPGALPTEFTALLAPEEKRSETQIRREGPEFRRR